MAENNSAHFTAAARDLLSEAERLAGELGHGSATSQHLLLALVSAPLGTAGAAFAENGWGPERLRQRLLAEVTAHVPAAPPFGRRTPDFLQALELAEAEADRRGHYYVDPDHLLLGVLSEGSAAAEALGRLGIMRSAIYVAVEQRMWGVLD
jgi:ATP-dependent Clp protease ATP-binding subunit ClpC